MNTSRRKFIKTTGAGTLGLGFLPALNQITNIFETDLPSGLTRTTPESQGVSSKAILNFINAANASGLGWHSFMLLRHGKVISEGWWSPFEPGFRHTLYSLSKSFTSTAIGLLVKEGKLNIDTPVISFFPDDAPAMPEENLKKMKVKHLLTMNTGHGEDTMPKMRASDKPWTKTFLEQKVNFEPSTHFLYNTGATYMLGAIVHKITGETLEKYLTPRLFQPLDIKGYDPRNPYAIGPDEELVAVAAEEQAEYKTIPQMEKAISRIKKDMEKAARDLDFMEAARLRDEMFLMQKSLEEMKK